MQHYSRQLSHLLFDCRRLDLNNFFDSKLLQVLGDHWNLQHSFERLNNCSNIEYYALQHTSHFKASLPHKNHTFSAKKSVTSTSHFKPNPSFSLVTSAPKKNLKKANKPKKPKKTRKLATCFRIMQLARNTDLCGTDEFVWNWRIYVEMTGFGAERGLCKWGLPFIYSRPNTFSRFCFNLSLQQFVLFLHRNLHENRPGTKSSQALLQRVEGWHPEAYLFRLWKKNTYIH